MRPRSSKSAKRRRRVLGQDSHQMITGIIANDYRKIHGDVSNEEKLGPNPKGVAGSQSHAGDEEEHGPKLKGEAGLHKVMERG